MLAKANPAWVRRRTVRALRAANESSDEMVLKRCSCCRGRWHHLSTESSFSQGRCILNFYCTEPSSVKSSACRIPLYPLFSIVSPSFISTQHLLLSYAYAPLGLFPISRCLHLFHKHPVFIPSFSFLCLTGRTFSLPLVIWSAIATLWCQRWPPDRCYSSERILSHWRFFRLFFIIYSPEVASLSKGHISFSYINLAFG